jgi:hypothetical protein
MYWYRGFKRKGDRVLGYNIITAQNPPLGLKRCSGTFGSLSDLKEGLVQWSRWWKYCSLAHHHTNLKSIQTGFVSWLPIVRIKYRHLYQLCYVKVFSTNQDKNLILLGYPGRVRSQIASIVRQIQRFDFDCNLVVTRKVIIWTRSPLRSNIKTSIVCWNVLLYVNFSLLILQVLIYIWIQKTTIQSDDFGWTHSWGDKRPLAVSLLGGGGDHAHGPAS